MVAHEASSLVDVATVVGVTAFLAVFVIALLWRPLERLLTEVCGTEDRANFWTIYSALFLFLLPLLVATATPIEGDVGRFVRLTIFFSDLGIAVALFAVGYAVWSRLPKTKA